MNLQRQLIALAIAGGITLGVAHTVAAETVYVVPASPQGTVIYQEPNVYVAETVVVPTYNPTPAPEIIVGRGATDQSSVYRYERHYYRRQPGFTVNTTPGYMGEQNARP